MSESGDRNNRNAENDELVDVSPLFEKAQQMIPLPPEWINFEHPDFPEYFYIGILDEQGNPKTWWQRLPESIRHKYL